MVICSGTLRAGSDTQLQTRDGFSETRSYQVLDRIPSSEARGGYDARLIELVTTGRH